MLTAHCSVLLGALLTLAPLAGWAASPANAAPNAANNAATNAASNVPAAPSSASFPIRQFVIDGNTLLTTERLLAELAPYVGDAKNADVLAQVRDSVLHAYRVAGYQMVSVALPPSVPADGVVRLRVHETRIGKVTVSGNEHFSEQGLRAALPALKEQESPSFLRLSRQLFLVNDNPSRQVALAFSPGEGGTADVAVKVADEPPLKMALSLDNTGTHATGRARATLLATHANLWDAGHEAAASYTTSPTNVGQVRQFGLSYMIPLPALGDRLHLSYIHSNTDAGRVADLFNVAGQGTTVGLRYQHYMHRTAHVRHILELGVDDKHYENTIDFFGNDLGVDVDARPVSLSYQYSARNANISLAGSLGYAQNLSGGKRNDDATYDASRSGATASWNLWRAYLDYRTGAPSQWGYHAVLEGQYTNEALISGEQFGLGGARSVRGFPERDSSGDRGWRLSNEVLTPTLADQHRFLGFIDGGRQSRVNVLPGEDSAESLMSYGLGWRWTVGRSMISALDWARVVNGTPGTRQGHQAVHFSAVWRFI